MGTAELMQQLAMLSWLNQSDERSGGSDTGGLSMLAWLNKNEEGEELYKIITGARVAYELWSRISSQKDVDTYQAQCILGIVEFIKKNPKATEDQLAKEVQKQIELFKAKVAAL
jgi:hypothetical protein